MEIVRLAMPDFIEDFLRGTLERNQDFGGREGQSLTGPYVKRHTCPAPGIDMEPHRGERLNL